MRPSFMLAVACTQQTLALSSLNGSAHLNISSSPSMQPAVSTILQQRVTVKQFFNDDRYDFQYIPPQLNIIYEQCESDKKRICVKGISELFISFVPPEKRFDVYPREKNAQTSEGTKIKLINSNAPHNSHHADGLSWPQRLGITRVDYYGKPGLVPLCGMRQSCTARDLLNEKIDKRYGIVKGYCDESLPLLLKIENSDSNTVTDDERDKKYDYRLNPDATICFSQKETKIFDDAWLQWLGWGFLAMVVSIVGSCFIIKCINRLGIASGSASAREPNQVELTTLS